MKRRRGGPYTGRMRFPTLLPLLLVVTALAAPAQPADAGRIGYPSVAAALKALEARDGDGTVVTHPDGWTIINEPLATAQWSFVPAGHAAYPAVVRRVIRRGANGTVSVDTASLCEAGEAACTQLLAEFAALNERITQAARARGRPTPPMPLPGQ